MIAYTLKGPDFDDRLFYVYCTCNGAYVTDGLTGDSSSNDIQQGKDIAAWVLAAWVLAAWKVVENFWKVLSSRASIMWIGI